MVQRFAQSAAVPSSSGDFVRYADYQELLELLGEALNDAQNYFIKVESREMTAIEADAVLRISVRLA